MNPERIIDLEKFLKEHVRCPYQSMIPDADGIRLNNFYEYIIKYPDWWTLVADRIEKIGFRFPSYIQHDLVDVINSLQERR